MKKFRCIIYAGYNVGDRPPFDEWRDVKASDPIFVDAVNRDQAVSYIRRVHVAAFLQTLKPTYRVTNDNGTVVKTVDRELKKITAAVRDEDQALREMGAVGLFPNDDIGQDGKLDKMDWGTLEEG